MPGAAPASSGLDHSYFGIKFPSIAIASTDHTDCDRDHPLPACGRIAVLSGNRPDSAKIKKAEETGRIHPVFAVEVGSVRP
jgi:hypothetical protein